METFQRKRTRSETNDYITNKKEKEKTEWKKYRRKRKQEMQKAL